MSFLEKYLKEPFDYATSDLTKILIGSLILSFIQILLILIMGHSSVNHPSLYSIFLLNIRWGYCIGVVKNTLKGMDTLPDWSNFIEIIVDGFIGITAFLILYFILYLPFVQLSILSEEMADILAAFIALLYSPIAMANLAKKGFFGFFDFPDVLGKISFKYISILIFFLCINSFKLWYSSFLLLVI